jgi:excisionase family DNA binding protein
MSRKLYTTIEAAKAAKISRPTIQYWIATGRIEAPELQIHNGKAARLWTEAAVDQMRKLRDTLKPGPQARSKKKK